MGDYCYYCERVWRAKYRLRVQKIQDLEKTLGTNIEALQKFKSLVKLVIDWIIQKDCNYNVKMPWDDFDKEVLAMEDNTRVQYIGLWFWRSICHKVW